MASIMMLRGNEDPLPLLNEGRKLALDTMEAQRMLPMLTACLEYEWLTGTRLIDREELDAMTELLKTADNNTDNSSFIFWLHKARGEKIAGHSLFEGYRNDSRAAQKKAVTFWKQCGCPYEEAILLFDGDEDEKRTALNKMQQLGATAVHEKLKQLMRGSGIKSIPRGIRRSTQANAAHLTLREIDIVGLLKQGLQNKEIADKLFISPKTVDHHISSILFKLDVNSRTKAAQEALRLGIIK
jgi:DNA-binding CsgD family transcriptional regulator